jgi:hypothetical protein
MEKPEMLSETMLSLIFSGTVAISTVVYAILTWQLVSETRKMRSAETEPLVWVSVQPNAGAPWLLNLVIQNIGPGPAYRIGFSVSTDFITLNNKLLSEAGPIKNGLKHLAPHQKVEFILTNMVENAEEKAAKPFSVTAHYRDLSRKNHEVSYLIDLSEFLGYYSTRIKTIHNAVEELSKMNDQLGRIETALQYLQAPAQEDDFNEDTDGAPAVIQP